MQRLNQQKGFIAPTNSATKTLRLKSRQTKVLLLQGPIGPFFSELQKTLDNQGFDVKRVLFNAADRLFTHGLFTQNQRTVRFTGNASAWEQWLKKELTHNTPDCIILFGSMRPAHQIARKLASELSIETLALEEGYLRSGYITCEPNGNNQHSPLRNWQPNANTLPTSHAPVTINNAFLKMCVWASLYYLCRNTFSKHSERSLYHRKTSNSLREVITWSNSGARSLYAKAIKTSTVKKLYSDYSKQFILVPLQTPGDSQIQTASRGWSNHRLINQVLIALKKCPNQKLVAFKLHPLDTGSHKTKRLIQRLAHRHQVSERVVTLRTGEIGKLTSHASGMIVLIARDVKSEQYVKDFLQTVKAKALLPGDFYARKGRRIGTKAIVNKLHANESLSERLQETVL